MGGWRQALLAKILGNQLEITEGVGALARVSLASTPSPGHLRIHRLVQAVTRDQLDIDQTTAWAQRALNLVSAIFPSEPGDYRSWPACASIAPHVPAAAGHVSNYPALTRQAGGLLTSLGIYLSASAQFTAARPTLEWALAIKEAAYDPDHPEIARTLTNLGIVQWQLGDLEGARTTQERALAIEEAAYGPDHPEVAKTLGNLGEVRRDLGDLEGARTTFERALAIFQAAYGPDYLEVATTRANLDDVKRQLGAQ